MIGDLAMLAILCMGGYLIWGSTAAGILAAVWVAIMMLARYKS